eukprot:NODE_11900_length_292_cov_18424.160494_g10987_i0.p2 GENE.NODE_11900_length_292_cov_18424.160494_g10987_i0~~NODE_11900_length_292_cov_18424.160494_g10987_i0.p2  ORF type:complete len:62 (+),score=10.81 NODE_11900_length_292_cov_18424.160494_g10987_i0:34-219(+)
MGTLLSRSFKTLHYLFPKMDLCGHQGNQLQACMNQCVPAATREFGGDRNAASQWCRTNTCR